MKTILAAVAICLVFAPKPAPATQKSADANQRNPYSDKQIAKPLSSSITKENPSQHSADQNSSAIKGGQNERAVRIIGLPPRSTGDTIALGCEIVLSLIGIIGIVVAVCTVRAINRQADIMESQTIAIEKQAEAMVNSERAWLIAELVPVCRRLSGGQWVRPIGDTWTLLSDDERLSGLHLRHILKITNMGRTAAQIMSFQITYSHLAEGIKDLQHGIAREFVEKREIDLVLGGTDATEIQEPLIEVNEHLGESVEQLRAIRELKETLVIHGWVTYSHVFTGDGEPEVVTFQYTYSPTEQGLKKTRRHENRKEKQNKAT